MGIPEQTKAIAARFQNEAFPRFRKRTVPLYGFQSGLTVLDRSGVFLQIAQQHFILTAAHYLPEIIAAQEPMFVGVHSTERRPVYLGDAKCHITDENITDIGIIELTKEQAEALKPEYEPILLRDIDTSYSHRQPCMTMCGYPKAWHETVEGRFRTSCVMYSTWLYRGETLNDPFDKFKFSADKHLALDVTRDAPEVTTWEIERLPDAEGMKGISGCGIWRMGFYPEMQLPQAVVNWRFEDCKLIGIEHRFNDRSGYVIGTKIREVLDFLFSCYPELGNARKLIIPG